MKLLFRVSFFQFSMYSFFYPASTLNNRLSHVKSDNRLVRLSMGHIDAVIPVFVLLLVMLAYYPIIILYNMLCLIRFVKDTFNDAPMVAVPMYHVYHIRAPAYACSYNVSCVC